MPNKYYTLTPAYGRDYKSKAAVQEDFDADKDFTCTDMENYGRKTNKSDLETFAPDAKILIRYKGLTMVTEVKR